MKKDFFNRFDLRGLEERMVNLTTGWFATKLHEVMTHDKIDGGKDVFNGLDLNDNPSLTILHGR